MQSFLQDFRYGARVLVKSPSFSAIAMLTLALGIGGSSAIFSVIDNALLHPFPYADAEHLLMFEIHDPRLPPDDSRMGLNPDEFRQYAAQNHVFDHVIGDHGLDVLYFNGEGSERFHGDGVSPNAFELLGVKPLLGRGIIPADGEPGANPVFVLRYKTWVSRFSGDPSILNKTFVLNGTPHTLVGIMPPRFAWGDADIWIPQSLDLSPSDSPDIAFHEWLFLGHLKPGVSMPEAQADLSVVARQIARSFPDGYPKDFSVRVRTLAESSVGRFRTTLFIAFAAVGLLLLIGCANVANLSLARATTREKEFTIRSALGAGRSRLAGQLLAESLLVAMGGGALGVVVAWAGLKAFVATIPDNIIPAESVIRMNGSVLLFTVAVAIATVILFGLAPALHVSRRNLNDALRDSVKGSGGAFRRGGVRNAVAVFEVALSLTLLIGAGLLMRSFVALHKVNLGLQPDHILVVRTPLPEDRYKTAEQVTAFFRPLLARLKTLPGVVGVAETSALPPYGGLFASIEIPGQAHGEDWNAALQLCSSSYFDVLRIRFVQGRSFNESEMDAARKLAVVNQTFARRYFDSANPVGKRVRVKALETYPDPVRDAWFEVIGMTADVKNQGLEKAVTPEMWVPYTVTGSARRGLLIRTSQDPKQILNGVRREIWGTDRNVALTMNDTLESYIQSFSFAQPRFEFLLLAIFAGIGLVLVTIGVYSVIAFTTAHRTHEIGLRMALGAARWDVLQLVLVQGGKMALAGIALGIAASLALTRLLADMLFEVRPTDPVTFAGVALLLFGVALVASYIPARRASRVDPLVALRYE